MEKINYKVGKANQEQMELVFDKFYKSEKRKDISVIFIAFDDSKNIIGYLVIEEKTIEPPLSGINWWIWHIYTQPELRRQGIASALLEETIKHAKQENVRHLQGSANPTLKANMFWFKNNFCFFRYGQKIDNTNNPEEYGNYSKMIFYRIDKIKKENQKEQTGYRIIKADKEQANYIFDEYILNINPEYFKDKRNDIFTFSAIDKDENIAGFIMAYADEMYAPLEGNQWLIPYIFVSPELRRQGIGSALVREIIKSAKEANITQLTAVRVQDATEFWYNNNFDMFYWSAVGKVNTAVVAGLRLL